MYAYIFTDMIIAIFGKCGAYGQKKSKGTEKVG